MRFAALKQRRLKAVCSVVGMAMLILAYVESLRPTSIDTTNDMDSPIDNYHRAPSAGRRRVPEPSVGYVLPATYTTEDVRTLFSSINRDQLVANEETFALVPIKFVLLIMVHDRAEYLVNLIDSLSSLRRVEEALVVFSHDVYNEHIFRLVHNISFARVMQIAFPFSIQLFPDSFPGPSSSDCPRDASQTEARQMNCSNWASPDQYGHYRESKFTAIKHHWWWKLSHMMDKSSVVSEGAEVVMLEEDHYLAPDALQLLASMRHRQPDLCPQCSLLQLGHFQRPSLDSSNPRAVRIESWKCNMAFVLRRSTWNDIKSCAKEFCTYDDYNWDWSLVHVSKNCIPGGELTVLIPTVSRVLHTGVCGFHAKSRKCDPKQGISEFMERLGDVPLTPPGDIQLVGATAPRLRMTGGRNGGWSDPRDHTLCMSFVSAA